MARISSGLLAVCGFAAMSLADRWRTQLEVVLRRCIDAVVWDAVSGTQRIGRRGFSCWLLFEVFLAFKGDEYCAVAECHASG